MTPKDTAALLAYFANAWPQATVTEEQAAIWADQLSGVDPDDGRSAARALVASSEWFPTVAAFREACLVAARRRTGGNWALPQPEQPVEQRKRFLGLVRSILSDGLTPCEAMGRTLCPDCQRSRS